MKKTWRSTMVSLLGCIALVMTGTAGCTSVNVSQTMQAWVGHHYSELIVAWGPPDRKFSDGRGGQIFIYTRTLPWVPPATSTTTYQQNVTRGSVIGQSTTVYDPAVLRQYTSYRMFWIDKDGIIYSWASRSP